MGNINHGMMIDNYIITVFFKDGKLEGEYKEWCPSGQLHKHYFYYDGKLEGEYKEWYGEFKDWIPNEQLYKHCFYKNGKLEGEYKQWHPIGQLCYDFFYKDGKLVR